MDASKIGGMTDLEVWRDINWFEGAYQVSSSGRVRSLDRIDVRGYQLKGRELKACRNGSGYRKVTLYSGRTAVQAAIHSLVAEAFIGDRPAGWQVNHKNGVKTDNRAENLEYVSAEGNSRHAYDTGLHKPVPPMLGRFGARHNKSKPVEAMINGEWVRFDGQMDAARKVGISNVTISRACLGQAETAGGYRWRFAE